MNFSFNHMSFANLFENGHNYITFSIMGMLIVFAGLSFISIYIILLSKVLNRPPRPMSDGKNKKAKDAVKADHLDESELLLVIAVALHLHQTWGTNYEKITWNRREERESAWLTAGRMRGLAVRSHLPERRIPGE
jgi:sodium pump decarboxylase gamma subunit